MMIAIKRTILALLLCLSWVARAEAQSALPTPGPYVLFIHCGPKKADDKEVKGLAIMLAKLGYSVREPEEDQDNVGGPGVDYFVDQAKGMAQVVADQVNGYFAKLRPPQPPNEKLQPRKQNAKNSPYYLGVWLY
jgi:hypothetical protein